MGMPSAAGLFHRASAQSGGGGNIPSKDQQKEVAQLAMKDLGFAPNDTEPTSMGTFFEISGAASKKERMLITLPSTHGDHPTRGLPGAPGPIMGGPAGLI